jgi:hypothetical protein
VGHDHRLDDVRLDDLSVPDFAHLGDPAGIEHGEAAMGVGRDQNRASIGYIELFCRSTTQKLKLRFSHGASPPTRQCPLACDNILLAGVVQSLFRVISQDGYFRRQSA